MRALALAGLLLLAPLFLAGPAIADTHLCRFTFEQAVADSTSSHLPLVVFTDADAVKAEVEILAAAGEKLPDGITRVLFVQIDDSNFYGFEIDGCASPPIQLPDSVKFPSSA